MGMAVPSMERTKLNSSPFAILSAILSARVKPPQGTSALVGGPERGLEGDRHLVYPKGTPLANLSLSLMAKFGVREEVFGDSTGHLPLLSGV